MSTYQSINMSLDASDHWKLPTYKYDLSGKATATPKEIRIEPVPEQIQVGIDMDSNPNSPNKVSVLSPTEYATNGELAALMGSASDDHEQFRKTQDYTQQKPGILALIIVSTLIFGFSIGFSFGYYYASEKGLFQTTMHRNGHGHSMNSHASILDVDIDQEFLLESKKALQFMDEVIFKDHGSSIASANTNTIAESLLDPLLRFPFQPPTITKPRPLAYLNRPDAYALLMDSTTAITSISEYSTDFFLISSGLDAQLNQAYCGVATVVAILNSLRFIKIAEGDDGVDIPTDPVYDPYAYATQVDIFDACTKANVIGNTGGGPGIDGILTPPYGLNMEQVAALLQCHLQSTKTADWKVVITYVDETHQTVGKTKFDLKNALADPNSRILVNYDRSVLGQNGGGHWSPIGSYSEKQDAFLILDVAKYKYPPVWVPSDRLFDSMSTVDDCGEWDFPNAQNSLSREERMSQSLSEYSTTMKKLDCKSKLRGYIVVSKA